MPKDKISNSRTTTGSVEDNVVYFDFKKAQAEKTRAAWIAMQEAPNDAEFGSPATAGISPGKPGPQPVVEPEESIAQWLRAYCENATDHQRFQRAKKYVAEGRVRHLTIAAGFVAAAVHGTQNEPFQVSVSFPKRSKAEVAELREYLSAAPEHLSAARRGKLQWSKLQNLFFDQRHEELKASCNCPDRPVFCKHVNAVLLHFAGQIAEDPAVAFEIREIALADIQLRLTPRQAVATTPNASESHEHDPAAFWLGSAFPDLPEAHPVDFFHQADEVHLREALKSVSALPIEQIRAFADLEEIYEELMRNQSIEDDDCEDDNFDDTGED
ncbi:MAG: hypothetical protein Q3976_01140 [Corynebacterium sp.]|nr:hypothetical protein [Corynebacterium sp.]